MAATPATTSAAAISPRAPTVPSPATTASPSATTGFTNA
jgi:hypothetical protein